MVPEQVLVFEVAGSVENFRSAVQRVGLEWLGDFESSALPGDEDFFDASAPDKPVSGRAYLALANHQAQSEMLRLWRQYSVDEVQKFPWGFNKWRDVFDLLRDIRPWGIEERLMETGILADWESRVEAGEESVRFEVELWFRDDPGARRQSEARLVSLLNDAGGSALKISLIEGACYHAVLAELPIDGARSIMNDPDTKLVRCQQVMFFRATGMAAVPRQRPPEQPRESVAVVPSTPASTDPVVAILDGLVLPGHVLLTDRVIVDDPDAWEEDYPAEARDHGTAMASIVAHGDLAGASAPLPSTVYTRPILRPQPSSFFGDTIELIPDSEIPADLVHRAVVRLFGGESKGVAPTVRIINLSVCDRSFQFHGSMSPWARVLDWLSFRYGVLFVVSAGNHPDTIEFDLDRTEFSSLSRSDREDLSLNALADDLRNRRVLSPAESINALSVGSSHADSSGAEEIGTLFDLMENERLPSPISAFGLGLNRAMKPDVLAAGGKQLYAERPSGAGTRLTPSATQRPPGVRHAAPPALPGDVRRVSQSRGTSNAAALVSRAAALAYHTLAPQFESELGELPPRPEFAALLKCLVAHSSRWGSEASRIAEVLSTRFEGRQRKEFVSRFIGYGSITPDWIAGCEEYRATALACDRIDKGEAHTYRFPLPPCLSGQRVPRTLVVTLAWITPVNPRHRKYRRAALWFDPPKDELRVDTRSFNHHQVRRGTLQHEVLSGQAASAFVDGDELTITIGCAEDAGALEDSIPYALAVSLEVAEGLALPIYSEIRERLEIPVRVRPRA